MQNIENEFMLNAIVSKQNYPNYSSNHEKFSSALSSTKKEEIASENSTQEVNIFMQSLQYQAQLNRMIIEHIA